MVKKLTFLVVLEPFLSRPRERLHLTQIAREVHLPHPTVRLWLNAFVAKGLLRKARQGRLTLYTLQETHPHLLDYLILAEKSHLLRRCENELVLRELVHMVQMTFPENAKAVIFGSATKSFQSANDIDLLVTGIKKDSGIKQFSKKYNKDIHLIRVSSLSAVSRALKAEILKKHLILRGSEDVVRWLLW